MKEEQIVMMFTDELIPYNNNPRFNEGAVDAVARSINEFGFRNPIIVDKNNVIIAGHTRLKASQKLGLKKVPVIIADDLTDEQANALRLVDNKTNELADWDFDKLKEELDAITIDMSQFGFDTILADFKDKNDFEDTRKKIDGFFVPTLSVLRTGMKYWHDRKVQWNEMIGDDGSSRGKAKQTFKGVMTVGRNSPVSVLDPVLAELGVRWFMPTGEGNNKCFDVFAGDTAFGFVSSYLGKLFTGIELRQGQADFNAEKTKGMSAKYICDDGRNVLNHIEENSQDFLFSCPPYFDIEKYSDLPNDASNQKTYQEFYSILDEAFSNAIKCLKDNRFAMIVVGDIRGKDGGYYSFQSDIINTFKRNGMMLYNYCILEDMGKNYLRASNLMKYRKIVKIHQDVLVFFKGDQKKIKEEFGELDFSYMNDLENNGDGEEYESENE